MTNDLQTTFGNIDIYLFDQLLKGRFNNCRSVIDIGCGGGRNIHYFLRNGYEVYGVDRDPSTIATVKELACRLSPGTPSGNFVTSAVEDMPFAEASFDIAICSAVLHFAHSRSHFEQMLYAIWQVIKPGGFFFARLASDIGIEPLVNPIGDGRYKLPDGSARYLVNHDMLLKYTEQLGGELFEPIKTTNVSNLRCMTTWCLQKK